MIDRFIKIFTSLVLVLFAFTRPSFASCAQEPGEGLWVNQSKYVSPGVPQRLEILGAHCGGPVRDVCNSYSCLPGNARKEGPVMRVWATCDLGYGALCDWGQVDLFIAPNTSNWTTAARTGSQWVSGAEPFSTYQVNYSVQYSGYRSDLLNVYFTAPGKPQEWVIYTFQRSSHSKELDINRPGMDYSNFEMPSTARDLDCLQHCASDTRCKAYAFGRNQQGRPHCWLKNGLPPAVNSTGWVSGIVSHLGQEPITYEWGTDRAGSDYKMIDLYTNDYGICAQQCLQDGSCDSYTFVPAGMQGELAKCWLKRGVPAARPGLGLVSGVKQR